MTTPTLSVCIPTYNRADLLDQALARLTPLLHWDFDVEIVVADNCSTDSTRDVIARRRSTLPPIRILAQERNMGAQANTIAVLQAAKGRYTVYMADDDEIIAEKLNEVLRFMLADPEIGVCHCPWQVWDRKTQQGSDFYSVHTPREFSRKTSIDMFNYLVQEHILPEIAVYRTDILHRVLFYPHRAYVGYLFVFRAVRYAKVAYHPAVFYRSIARPDGGVTQGPRGQMGHMQAITYLDRYRGSLEISLLMALQDSVPLPIPDAMRQAGMTMINEFIRRRILVASRLSMGLNDPVAAHEFQMRNMLWDADLREEEVRRWEADYLPLVALRLLLDLFEGNSCLKTVAVCGFLVPEGIVDKLKVLSPDAPVQVMSTDELLTSQKKSEFIVLMEAEDMRDHLIGEGFLPGYVLTLDQLADGYRVLPRRFAQVSGSQ